MISMVFVDGSSSWTFPIFPGKIIYTATEVDKEKGAGRDFEILQCCMRIYIYKIITLMRKKCTGDSSAKGGWWIRVFVCSLLNAV